MDSTETESESVGLVYPVEWTRFAAVSAGLLAVVGVAGNLLTILALLRDAKLRSKATTAFVVSLAVSDLLFCMVNLPLTAVRFHHRAWILGPLLCRVFPFLFYGNMAASLMNMVAITVNRVVSIAWYRQYHKIYSNRNVLIMIAFVWIFSFGMIFPPLVDIWGTLGLDKPTFSCTIKKLDGKSPKKFLFLVAFLLPSVAIMVSYSAIFYSVRRSRGRLEARWRAGGVQRKAETRVRGQMLEDLQLTKLMLSIFLLFLLCFLPLMLVNVFDKNIHQPGVHIVAAVLAWTSAAINPVIYTFTHRQYRQAVVRLLCGSGRGRSSGDGGGAGRTARASSPAPCPATPSAPPSAWS